MFQVQQELEYLLSLINLVAHEADCILEQLKPDMKSCLANLDMTLLDIISECYLMKTPITLALGSMTSTENS